MGDSDWHATSVALILVFFPAGDTYLLHRNVVKKPDGKEYFTSLERVLTLP